MIVPWGIVFVDSLKSCWFGWVWLLFVAVDSWLHPKEGRREGREMGKRSSHGIVSFCSIFVFPCNVGCMQIQRKAMNESRPASERVLRPPLTCYLPRCKRKKGRGGKGKG